MPSQRRSRKLYEKGRVVEDLYDFCRLCAMDARFIKDEMDHPFDEDFFKRHPRAKQAQTAMFMRSQQFWYIKNLIDKKRLFVADRINVQPKLIGE